MDPKRHELVEAAVNVQLEGEFAAAYTDADNSHIIATDTCKNTVYAIAKDDPFETIESFGLALARHFLSQYSHVDQVTIELRQQAWERLFDCSHAFHGCDSEVPTARVVARRDQACKVTAGIDQLMVAKTTESGFENFHRDEFRTLSDTSDRILATSVTADWTYSSCDLDFVSTRKEIRDAMLRRFTDHYSHSVQETLWLMGNAALETCADVDSITLTMPNKHHILFDLKPLNRENNNDVFVVTDEPFGYISATVTRDE